MLLRNRNIFHAVARIVGRAATRRGGVRLHTEHRRGLHQMAAQLRGFRPSRARAHQHRQPAGGESGERRGHRRVPVRGHYRGVLVGVDRGHAEPGHAEGVREPADRRRRRRRPFPDHRGQHRRPELREARAERPARVNPIL